MIQWRYKISKSLGFFWQRRAHEEFSQEVETHIEMLTERFVRQGMNRNEANCAARRQFGNTALLKQQQSEARTWLWLSTVLQDVRYGMRMLARNPGFTSIAVVSLALGIGANTAIFTLAKAALFDALRVPNPEQLRLLAYAQGEHSVIENDWGDFYQDAQGRTILASFSWPVYQELRRQNNNQGELFAFVDLGQFEHLSATVDGHAEAMTAELVSGNFFSALGVRPALGRSITPDDDATPGAGAVTVISDAFWKRRFAGSTSVIGKTIDVNLTPVTIIGVAPPGFTGASHVQTSQDLYMPFSMQPVVFPREKGSLLSDPNTWWLQIMMRLNPGVPDSQAATSLAVALNQAVRATMVVAHDREMPSLLLLPGDRGWNYAEQELEHPIPLLLAIAGLVLLLTCVNVANLLLARFSARQREVSVRMAIGAGRLRMARQMMTESLCLSTLGGALGLLLGYLGRALLPQLLSTPWGAPALTLRFDWRVFAFTAAVSIITGLGFGVGPAWRAAGNSPNSELKGGTATITRRRSGIAGKALVIVQVSLCMLLLVTAGLFVRTLANLNAIDPGFNKRGLLLFAIEPLPQRYPAPRNVEVLHRIEERIAALPGVGSATLSKEPLLAQSGSNGTFIPEGQTEISKNEQRMPLNTVGQSFFATMGIPILYGRSFSATDTSSSPAVAVISQALAKKEFAGKNPVGLSFRRKEGGDPIRIIGICANAKYAWIRDDVPPLFYLLYTQQKDLRGSMTYEVRTKGDPLRFAGAVRSVVESVDKDLPLLDLRTQQQQIDAALAPERSFAAVSSGFGFLAVLLASLGVYGVIAASVSRRVNEIGVRMALGARAEQVLRMVMGEAAGLAAAGVATGLVAALIFTRFLKSVLFGLRPADPFTLIGAGLLLLIAAVLAAWAPARRASQIQPIQALRQE